MAGFFRRLLGLPRRSACPYCLGECSLGRWDRNCNAPAGCGRRLPQWARDEKASYPPLGVQLLGLPGAGKTSYAAALYPALANLLTVWPDFFVRFADAETGEFVRRTRGELGASAGPPADGACYVAHGLPRRWLPGDTQGRTLILREHGSPHYDPDERGTDRRFLRNVRAFVLCVPWLPRDGEDRETRDGRQAMQLAEVLRRLRELVGASLGSPLYSHADRASLVVNFTQADRATLPAPLALYLRNDPLSFGTAAPGAFPVWGDAALGEYLGGVSRAGELVADSAAARTPQFRAELRHAEELGFRVRFCITSSVGIPDEPAERPDSRPRGAGVFVRVRPGEELPPPVESGAARTLARPLRVLDPIFTALELER